MRTTKDHQGAHRVLVSAFIEQKQTHRIKKNDGTYANLFMGYSDSSLNGWNSKPTVARALTEIDEIKVGDHILCPYVALTNDAVRILSSDLKRLGIQVEDGEEVFSISKDMCWMGIRDEKMFCIGENMICKRIYEPDIESPLIIVQDKKKYETYVYVEQMPEDASKYEFDGMGMDEIKVGDVIAVKKMSDVEFKYVWNNEHRSLIRVNFSRDFLGFINNNLEYQL
jgi:hypothetical protein